MLKDSLDYSRYWERNLAVKAIGFVSYRDYLGYELWLSIRELVLKRDQQRCYGCGRKATQVHHRSYAREVLAGTDLGPRKIVSICTECHRHIESEDGYKTPIHKANKNLEKLRRAYLHSTGAVWNDRLKQVLAEKTTGPIDGQSYSPPSFQGVSV